MNTAKKHMCTYFKQNIDFHILHSHFRNTSLNMVSMTEKRQQMVGVQLQQLRHIIYIIFPIYFHIWILYIICIMWSGLDCGPL